jgi:hypothetical protein
MRYIQHPVTHELIPADQFHENTDTVIHIIGDIQPYQSQIDGSIITSRSKHREHLKAHGCIEVGNDTLALKARYNPIQPPKGLKETLIRIANEKLKEK